MRLDARIARIRVNSNRTHLDEVLDAQFGDDDAGPDEDDDNHDAWAWERDTGAGRDRNGDD
jgi:hypothetical protein